MIEVEQLKTIVQRIECLEQEKANVVSDIKEIYLEAKGNGYDTKILKKIIKMRKKDAAKREEEESLLDTYSHALGMK